MKNVTFGSADNDYQKLGISRTPSFFEDGIRTNGGKGSYEWWYFDAEFEGGIKATVVFYTKDQFSVNTPAQPSVQLDLAFPGSKQKIYYLQEEKGKHIQAEKDRCNVSVRNCTAEYLADGRYQVHFEDPKNEITYDFILTPNLPMFRPATGHIHFGDQNEFFFAWFVGVPSGKMEATLSIHGQKLTLTGVGYHDHNWGNCMMNKLLNHWYWCRTAIGDYTVISCDIIAHKDYGYRRIPIFMLAKNGVILSDDQAKISVERLETHPHNTTKKFMDDHLRFTQQVGDTTYIVEYLRERDLVVVPLVQGYKKFIVHLLGMNPTYCRIVGKTRLTIQKDGKSEVLESEGLWEQMGFGSEKIAPIGSQIQ